MRKTEIVSTSEKGLLKFLYGTAFGRVLLRPVISKPVSFLCGAFLSTTLSKTMIKGFVKANNIDMSDYKEASYRSFNDFFTREIKPSCRPIASGENALISPCDARLTVYKAQSDCFTVKGVKYTLFELLCNNELAKKYQDGVCLIFRLGVDNYHRYCFSAGGEFTSAVHIKGKYHTVRPIAMSKYRVFRENVREYTVIHSDTFGDVLQMEVGALNVGKIANHGINGGKALKGEEKGKFLFGGSTVILLLEKDKVRLDGELIANTESGFETLVKYGEGIGIAEN